MTYKLLCLLKKSRNLSLNLIKENITPLINKKLNTKLVCLMFQNQVESFAGNMLELTNDNGDSVLVMSKSAEDSLDENQKNTITKYSIIVASDINTIEVCGGGSARCMMAEIFLPKK